jgi:hypothetical protein
MGKLLTTTALALCLASTSALAVPIIQFAQTSGSNTITATANASDTATTISGSDVAVNVTQDLGGYLGPALFTINATSTNAATPVGTGAVQNYSGSFSITNGATNVLSGSFTDAALGVGGAITLAIGSPPDILSLTSDNIPANQLSAPLAAAFSMTNVLPPIHIAGSTIDSFTATVSGNVSSSTVAIPEPGPLAVMGVGLLGLGLIKHRRRRT